ncbi:DHH family phosphoesterase [Fulvivirga sedimenti]|uniref:Bifunctional oligoribonuclease/PAP phosphatase NrnA n=1 Tax=Fulvivirga sedimenti TaxID=2879465 RepID=A0A9X1L0T9_9BACT|nr:bifunctional oligoribonuclease/PAP phosphatase NrnA [Fulvivirga sedimenti]MCA6078139.1 bifunctional oligoribonuclease/PAP phosphatase NrnA [Fulvivirga sedimenti]
MQNIEAFKAFLSKPQRVVITTHHKPDADALGSSLALASYLKKKGHQVHVITPTDYPDFLRWMAGNDEVIIYNENQQDHCAALVADATLIFCLDFSSLDRINELGAEVRESKAKKVLIDHHLEPEDFADFVKWTTEAAATAELIYELIYDLGDESLIDKSIAESLYAGIMTDTGSFHHPNTTKNVFRVCGELVGLGADTARVSKLIYDSNSVDRIKFIGFALSERLTVIPELRTAYFVISADDLKKYHSRTGDTEGLVNYALSIEGIIFAAVIIDRTEAIKMSFRSIGDFSVNTFARKHFEGGGHKNAAGGKSDESLEKTVSKFEALLKDYKKELTTTIVEYAD